MILGDSITHAINIADLERDTKKYIHLPGKKGTTGAKTKRCYTSSKGGKFPNNSFSTKLPEILEETHVDYLYLQTPTNDITNLSHLVKDNGTVNEKDINEVNTSSYKSSWAMVNYASIAVKNYPSIKKSHPDRSPR